LLLFPFAFYAGYHVFFTKKNKHSRNTEVKLGSHFIENKVIGPIITRKLLSAYDGKVFKQDTEECQLVCNTISKLLSNSKLEVPNLSVKLIYDDNLFMFLNTDGTFFVSSKCLKMCGNSEHKLALLLSHELSHFLLEHQSSRIL
jgi:hypothetical protein